MNPLPAPELVARFRGDMEELLADPRIPAGKLGVAVSGGPDSLALLVLAAAAYPGKVEAATVDHGFRAQAADEAALVKNLCEALGVPHHTLTPDTAFGSFENLQERARHMRYRLLGCWASAAKTPVLLTGHHAEDQAETFLMRAARGSGIGGLSAIRTVSFGLGDARAVVIRPLLAWRKATLVDIVRDARIDFVSDPSNDDPRHDRTRFRRLLAENGWLSADRFAKAAAHLAEGEDALDQLATMFYEERVRPGPPDEARLDTAGLPREIKRRMTWMAINSVRRVTGIVPDWRGGEDVDGLLRTLEAGKTGTLAGIVASGGHVWWFRQAPPRRMPSCQPE